MRRRQFHRWLRVISLEERAVPSTFTVTNLNGSGSGSLDQAIVFSNGFLGADTIQFAAGLTGTIQPNSLHITDSVTIIGPGASLLTLDGDGDNRLMNINIPGAGAFCNITGINFINGIVDGDGEGGAITARVDQLMLSGCVFTHNVAYDSGGAVAYFGSLTAVDCSFVNNVAHNAGAILGDGYTNNGSATFQRCTFSGNKSGGVGGAIHLEFVSAATFESCTVSGNSVNSSNSHFGTGGGISCYGVYQLNIRNCTISGNSASGDGGGICSLESVSVQNSTFSANKASHGGAISAVSVSLESSILYGDFGGSAPELDCSCSAVKSLIGSTGTVKISADAFTTNNIGVNPLLLPLGDYGGQFQTLALRADSPAINQGSNPAGLTTDGRVGAFVRVSGAAADIGAYELQPTTFKVLNNFDSGAGSLRQAMIDAQANPNSFDLITFDSTVFATPKTISLLSALPALTHDLQLVGPGSDLLTIRRNSGATQFSVFSFPTAVTVVISGMTISSGDTTGNGGGIDMLAIGAHLTLDHVIVTGNKAQTDGGGVFMTGSSSRLTLLDSTIASNTAAGLGGGIAIDQPLLDIERSTISGNTANGGGGISVIRDHAANVDDVTIINTTISGNHSTNAPGGGIRFDSYPRCIILNSTITNNSCSGAGNSGGGIGVIGSATVISATSTIISGNNASSAPDIFESGLAVRLNHCAIGNSQGFTLDNQGANLFGASLNLGPLADNGGPTKTHAILLGSPAIDAGSNSANLATDQRGGTFHRVAGAPDIGAYELQNTFLVTNTKDSGPGSLRQALLDSNGNPGPDIVEITNSVFGTITLTTGEIPISGPVSIVPPTFAAIVISGNNASRIFNTQSAPANAAISISGLLFSGGSSASGGAILGGDEAISLYNCGFTANKAVGATAGGGAIEMLGGTMSATNCSFTSNTAGDAGGAILARKTILESCTISGNTAINGWGGGVYAYGSSTNASSYFLAEDCTFSGNNAKGVGGALNVGYFTAAGTATIRNCTISGNSASDGGGIGLYSFLGTLNVQNSTITANTAGTKGGAIERISGTGTINIESSILFGDTAPAGPEILTTGTVVAKSSLVASKTGVTTFSSDAFTSANLGANPLLGPLANNGGSTQTHAILAGSPALDHGSNPASLITDQRGAGFARITSTQVDIGAFEVQPDFVVRNTKDSGTGSLRLALQNANTIPGADVVTFDPSVFNLPVTIKLTTGDIAISEAVTILGPLIATTISGNSSSRIFNCQTAPAGAAISISGLTFSGGSTSSGNGGAIVAGNQQITLTSCTLTGNAAIGFGVGGAVAVVSGSLTATDCVFSNNTASGSGGAINVQGVGATTTLRRCTISGNSVTFSGNGGGVAAGYSLLVEDCTLSGNKTPGASGAIDCFPATAVTIRNSTISGNSANGGGGMSIGTFVAGPAFVFQIQNCTFTANTSLSQGGAISISGNGTATIESSILFGDAAVSAPEISRSGAVTVNTSLIATKSGVTTFTDDAFTNANIGQDPLLGPLADNGGPTKTHAISAASLAINNGSNPAALSNDQRGVGFFRVNGGKVDIGAFELQAFPAAKVASLTINDGSAQRSRVTSLTVTFDSTVVLPANAADAFQLTRQSDGAIVGLSGVIAGNTVTLSFSSGPLDFGSLADGRYTLTVFAAKVNSGCFDGNSDGIGGDDFTLVGSPTESHHLFRLFGDADGNGLVDGVDFGAFRTAFNTNSNIFDFDGSSVVDGLDFGQFRSRFGAVV